MTMPRLFLVHIRGLYFACVITVKGFMHVIFCDNYFSIIHCCWLRMIFSPRSLLGHVRLSFSSIWLVMFALGSIFEQNIFIIMSMLFVIESSKSIFFSFCVVFVHSKSTTNDGGHSIVRSPSSTDHSLVDQACCVGDIHLLFSSVHRVTSARFSPSQLTSFQTICRLIQ